MITKIISDGQASIDLAALDVAIKLDIPHGGWAPKGRKPEDGAMPEKYKLQEIPVSDYPKHIEKNVLDSHGTLLLSHGELAGDAVLIKDMAEKNRRHLLHVDLNTLNDFLAAKIISAWIVENGIEILNISGPGTEKDPKIYRATIKLLETVLYLDQMGFSLGAAARLKKSIPKNVNDAADTLISKLSLRDKSIVANLNEENLPSIYFSLGEFIKRNFGLSEGNDELIASCRSVSGKDSLRDDDAVSIIIGEVWNRLRKTHRIRVIK